MSVKSFLQKYFDAEKEQLVKKEGSLPLSLPSPLPPPSQKKEKEEAWSSFFGPQVNEVKRELPPPGTLHPPFHLFTDGACSGNGRRTAKGAYGVFVHSDRTCPDVSMALLEHEEQTNNRAELRAIQAALDLIDQHHRKWQSSSYCIWSDSEYSINCVTKWGNGWSKNGWRKRDGNVVLNLDIIKPTWMKLQSMKNISLHHVKAHNDLRKDEFPWSGNIEADRLARAAIPSV